MTYFRNRQFLVFVVMLAYYQSPIDVACGQDGTPPNIVMIVADDLGYGELGCQGNSQIPTPNIDSIAASGVRFTQGYVTASFCSASRAGLLTGRYQTRFGYEANPIGAHNEDPDAGLPVGEKTIADVLVDTGYVTGLFGKWHLGGTAKYHPYRRGFDEFFGFLHEGHYFVPPPYRNTTTMLRRKTLPPGAKEGVWKSANGKFYFSDEMGTNEPDYDADNPIYRGGQPVQETEYLTDAITREAVDFIERNYDRPFFLYVAFNAVHSPLQGADRYMTKFNSIKNPKRKVFAAMLSNLDDGVGQILTKLQDEKLNENTLVIFLSDNGGPTKELTSSNLPLRDGKGSVYEGGLRVPFMMRWDGELPSGQTYDLPVVSTDIFATATAISGAKLDLNKTYDGVDLMPYLTGKNQSRPHEKLVWRMGNRKAIRIGDWKILQNSPRKSKTGDAKPWELYYLADDISESNNLADQQPEKIAELKFEWDHMESQMIDPIWTPKR